MVKPKDCMLVVAALLSAPTGFPQSLQFIQLPPGANKPSASSNVQPGAAVMAMEVFS